MKTPQELYDWLLEYINQRGGVYNEWYAGIATAPRDRLFSDHNVNEDTGAWAYDFVATDEGARAVEKALLELGCDGGGGGGSDTTRAVYVYFKTSGTRP